jgi:hypothetical protein
MLHGRRITIVAGIQGQPGTQISTTPWQTTGETSLHVAFHTTASTDGQPDRGVVEIFNPPLKMAKDLLNPPVGTGTFLSVVAHYENVAPAVIFAGVPIPGGVELEKAGGDFRLVISALSGGTRFRDAAVRVGLRGRVLVRAAATFLANDAGWHIERNDIPPTLAYPRGVSFGGSAAAALAKVAAYANCELRYGSGDGTGVDFISRDPTLLPNQTTAPEFSTARGNLVETPTRNDEGMISFKGLIVPGVAVGGQALLTYPDVLNPGSNRTDRLQLTEISYKGANNEREFYILGSGRRL